MQEKKFYHVLTAYLTKVKEQKIRMHQECEGGIEKPVSRISNWHHEACKAMTNRDHKGEIDFSHMGKTAEILIWLREVLIFCSQ